MYAKVFLQLAGTAYCAPLVAGNLTEDKVMKDTLGTATEVIGKLKDPKM